ncbi:MAG: phosphotransferase [Methylococcales symbiont of Hymedesmia sp. n. MRB-2018]|nr:MAG: phosphotransferase [Methylococcales symbiont of Hymedesmia sp. n. MRB-2018]
MTDIRKKSIIHWLENTLNLEITHFEVASSDASFRRYFRVTHQSGQHIVMDAPPEKENIEPFIRIAALFKQQGIHVPEIVHQDLAHGFLLLEDFGCHCLLDMLTSNNALKLYKSTFDCLHQLQSRIDINSCQLPYYNEALFAKELSIFYLWFLNKTLNLTIPDPIKSTLDQVLISSALEQPQVCVHRDFHCRNLMVLKQNSLGVIDFQDAVIGPVTYDLVSLLRDCYIAWPTDQVEQWMTLYFQRLTDSGLITTSLQTFTRWFDLMGLQRHLKAVGIFSRLHFRDQKSSYLQDIPRTLDYVSQVCKKYPGLESFNHYLKQNIIPAYASTLPTKP